MTAHPGVTNAESPLKLVPCQGPIHLCAVLSNGDSAEDLWLLPRRRQSVLIGEQRFTGTHDQAGTSIDEDRVELARTGVPDRLEIATAKWLPLDRRIASVDWHHRLHRSVAELQKEDVLVGARELILSTRPSRIDPQNSPSVTWALGNT